MAIFRFIFAFVLVVLLAVGANARLNQSGAAAFYSFPNGSLNNCATAGNTTANSLNFPTDVYIYNGNLLIADYENDRVLVVSQTTNAVISIYGQTDATTSTAATSATGLDGPYGIYVDEVRGVLYIADSVNNRVTTYALTELTLGTNHAATAVLGQTGFTTRTAGTSQTQLSGPRDVFVDSANDRLWVLDYTNLRVLFFAIPLIDLNNQAAEGVIGTKNTTDFNSVGTFFTSPNGVLVDTMGRLYISDTITSRVFRYDDATSNEPTLVFGQTDFTTTAPAASATGLNYPRSIAYDIAQDYLFISDLRNNRVVAYRNASTINTNGTAAALVIGQNSTTTNTSGCSPTQLNKPYGIYYDDSTGRLAVADDANFRAVEYLNNVPITTVSTSLTNSTSSFPSSIAPSLATTPTPAGLCVPCQSQKCGNDNQFDQICAVTLGNKVGGTRVGDSYCCIGATNTASGLFFISRQQSGSVTFGAKLKVRELCGLLGGSAVYHARDRVTYKMSGDYCEY